MINPTRKRLSTLARFARCLAGTKTGCWEWTASKDKKGYGWFWAGYKRGIMQAHRYSYIKFNGKLDRLIVDHLCRNASCVNPNHLEAVTRRENIARGNAKSAHAIKTNTCLNGHKFTKENTRLRKRKNTTTRTCKSCANERARTYYAASRSAGASCPN